MSGACLPGCQLGLLLRDSCPGARSRDEGDLTLCVCCYCVCWGEGDASLLTGVRASGASGRLGPQGSCRGVCSPSHCRLLMALTALPPLPAGALWVAPTQEREWVSSRCLRVAPSPGVEAGMGMGCAGPTPCSPVAPSSSSSSSRWCSLWRNRLQAYPLLPEKLCYKMCV